MVLLCWNCLQSSHCVKALLLLFLFLFNTGPVDFQFQWPSAIQSSLLHNGHLAASFKICQMDVVTPHLLPTTSVTTRILRQVLVMIEGQNYYLKMIWVLIQAFPCPLFPSAPQPPYAFLTYSSYLGFHIFPVSQCTVIFASLTYVPWTLGSCSFSVDLDDLLVVIPLMRLELSDGI